MNLFATTLFACALLLPGTALASENLLPAPSADALRSATKLILYSLEPWATRGASSGGDTLHGYQVLGKTDLDGEKARVAVREFEAAIAGFDGMTAACFDPRHAVRVSSDGHTYDFLLCYDCHSLAVYRDDRHFGSVGAAGSPAVLNELMSAAGLSLSQTGYKPPSAEEIAKGKADDARWQSAIPAVVRSIWQSGVPEVGVDTSDPTLAAMREALARETPDRGKRIRRLLAWFGSGKGPWSGYPSGESVLETLLLDYTTAEILAAVQFDDFTGAEREGAARLLAGWAFRTQRPGDGKLVPVELKRALLDHTMTTGDPKDDDRRKRAMSAFGPPAD